MLWSLTAFVIIFKQCKGNDIFLYPHPIFYTYLGYSTNISCYSTQPIKSIKEYEWTLNGTKPPANVDIERLAMPRVGFDYNRLLINNATRNFNGSTFHCKIVLLNSTTLISHPSTLYIQGALESIQDIRMEVMNGLILTWEPPFSYDLEDFDPDLTYCLNINVSSHSCGSVSIHSVCNLTAAWYHYQPLLKHFCFIFTVSIVASNFVGNSTPSRDSLSPECSKIKVPSCIPLPQIENGSISRITDPKLKVGTIAFFKCQEGYVPSSRISNIICNSTLNWDPDPKSLTCMKLPNCIEEHPTTRISFGNREIMICASSFAAGYFAMWIIGLVYCFSNIRKKQFLH